VKVRRATSADLETVIALRLALLREYSEHPIYGRLRPDAEQRARPIFAAQLDSDREAIFLAEENMVVAGLIRCVETAASPLLIPDRYCYVSSVYVRPEARRHGVLRALLQRAQNWCRERGLTEMRLHNVGSRESSAAAWDSLGFEVVEQVRVLHLATADLSEHHTSLADHSSTQLQL
jgi:GNAT superfamily N-acetyltransferase